VQDGLKEDSVVEVSPGQEGNSFEIINDDKPKTIERAESQDTKFESIERIIQELSNAPGEQNAEKEAEFVKLITQEFEELSKRNKSLKTVEVVKPSIDSEIDGLISFFDAKLTKSFDKIKNKILRSTIKFASKIKKSMIKKEEPKKTEVKPKHNRVTCDGCNIGPIEGVRYKCAVCADFDFCEACEELNKDCHPHPFIKIRCPERAPIKIACAISDEMDFIKKEEHPGDVFKSSDADFLSNLPSPKVKKLKKKRATATEVKRDFFEQVDNLFNKDINTTVEIVDFPKDDVTEEPVLVEVKEPLNLSFRQIDELNIKTERCEENKDLSKLIFEYGHQYKIIVTTYDLTGIPEQTIYTALDKAKGKIDEALALLF